MSALFASPPKTHAPPPAPAPPPLPAPNNLAEQASTKATQDAQRRAAALAAGRESTILTGTMTPSTTGGRTKLGES